MRISSTSIIPITKNKLVKIMVSIGRVTATRGNLLKLRTTLNFVQSAMSILEMKRDRLAAELNSLLHELNQRQKAEKQLMEIYADLKIALATLGYSAVFSTGLAVSKMIVEVNSVSIMGAIVPRVTIKRKPPIDSIENIGLHQVAEKQLKLIGELLSMAQIEASIERVTHELMKVNRKVNALEKVIVPTYERQIRYIEDLLFDEELEDFARIKHVKAVLGRKKT
jgi:V/A-type H+/Na+-transporting ATPase subunit D